jgi:ribosomal-protein-alanine N-acetyltransferase
MNPSFRVDDITATLPDPGFAQAVVDYYEQNRGRYGPIGPETPEGFFTVPHWEERLHRAREEHADGESLRLFLVKGDRAVGHVNFTKFIGPPLCQCFLGYALDAEHEGEGIFTRLLPEPIEYVFEEMHVHRIQANYLPANERSGALLRRLGFQVEGYARDYLLLHGQWRDHIMTSLINPSWRPRREGSVT